MERLEHLRQELRAERISYSELAELQSMADEGLIPSDDLEMLEAAGVPEFNEDCGSCGGHIGPSASFVWHYEDEDCRGIKQPVRIEDDVPIEVGRHDLPDE